MRSFTRFYSALSLVLAMTAPAYATRIVLAPGGLVANPSSAAIEYAARSTGARNWLGFATIGIPQADLGLELEVERYELLGTRGTAVSAQYSVTGNAFSDIAPAVSVGVRDLTNQGREGRAFYLSLTKTMGLSRAQERLVKDLKVHAGLGNSHLNGVFGGVTARLPFGPTLGVEYVRFAVNASASVPLGRNASVRVYSLDGHIFVGGCVELSR
jgi:hypothetical protein